MSGSTVLNQLLWRQEAMRTFIIIFVWTASITAYKNGGNVKDLEIALSDCMLRGRKIENVHQNCEEFDLDAYENIPSSNLFDLCRVSFHVACLEALEELDCTKGEASARRGENCDGNESDTFKKCCKACKFGAELKSKTSNCRLSSRLSGDDVKNVARRCCEEDIDELEEIECFAGEAAARRGDNCDGNESDTFKKCCSACRYGIELKSEFCGLNWQRSNDDFKNVTKRCCDDNLEMEARAPEALTATKRIVLSCLEYQCGDNEDCFDSANGPKCSCKSGFKASLDGCQDIDECSQELHSCSSDHKKCVNTQGSFRCQECLHGYEEVQNYFDDDGDVLCIDTNECKNGTACKPGEVCTNVDGGYRCTNVSCPKGYVRFNDTICKLASCSSKICHKTFSFHFKNVLASDKTNEIFSFPKTKYQATLDLDYFEIVAKKSDYAIVQKKPLPHDMKVRLIIKDGRFEHMKKINIFVSKL